MKNQIQSSILFLTISFLAVASAPNAHASNQNPEFEQAISEFQNQCDQSCALPFYVVQQAPPEKVLAEELQKVAAEQAQGWGDTILEGDYFAEGGAHLEAIETLYKDDHVLGYRIVYAERAWDTSNCRFNPNTKEGLESCQMGYIKETSFVAPNLKDAFVDEDNFATFIRQ